MKIKQSLAEEFEVKDIGPLLYFLGMEVAQSETGVLWCKHASTPMDPTKKLGHEEEGILVDKGGYQRLVGKIIYPLYTRPDIGFAMSAISQFMD